MAALAVTLLLAAGTAAVGRCAGPRSGRRPPHVRSPGISVGTCEVIQSPVFAGVMGAALLSAIWLIRERARTASENRELRSRVADLNSALSGPRRCSIARPAHRRLGRARSRSPNSSARCRWRPARREDRALPRLRPLADAALGGGARTRHRGLREKAPGFDLVVETSAARRSKAGPQDGGAYASCASVALRDAPRRQARLQAREPAATADHDTLLGLLDALNMPVLAARADGRLKWVNRAYAEAVEAEAPQAAVRDGKEFLGSQSRARRSPAQQHDAPVVRADASRRSSTATAGSSPSPMSRAATVRPASPSTSATAEAIREELRAHAAQPCRHARPADHRRRDLRRRPQAAILQPGLPEAVGPRRAASSTAQPDNALLLDRLRSDGKLAEQPEWRRWKENAARRLPRRRSAGALVAPARRPDPPRHRQPAAARAASPGCSRT